MAGPYESSTAPRTSPAIPIGPSPEELAAEEFRERHRKAIGAGVDAGSLGVQRGIRSAVWEDPLDAARYASGDLQRQADEEAAGPPIVDLRDPAVRAEEARKTEDKYYKEELDARNARAAGRGVGGGVGMARPREIPLRYQPQDGIDRLRSQYDADKRALEARMYSGELKPDQYQDELTKLQTASAKSIAEFTAQRAAHEKTPLGIQQGMSRAETGEQQRQLEHEAGKYDAAAGLGDEFSRLQQEGVREQQAHNELAAKADARAMRRQWEMADRIAEADKAVKSTHIDPARSWHGKNAPFKILGMIAAAMNGYVTAQQGRENEVLKMIGAQVDRDIEAQKVDLETKKQGAAYARSEFAILKEQLGDEKMARNALAKRKWEFIAQKAEQLKAQAVSDSQRKEAENVRQYAVNMGAQAEQGLLLQATMIQEQETLQEQARVAQANYAAQRAKTSAADPMGNLDWKGGKSAASAGERYLPGFGGFVRNEKDYPILAAKHSQAMALQDIASEVAAMSNEPGIWASPTGRAKAKMLQNRMAVALSVTGDGSVLRDAEREELYGILPSAGDWTTVDATKVANQVSAIVTNAAEREAEGRVDAGVYRRNPTTGDVEVAFLPESGEVAQRRLQAAEKRRNR